MSKRDQQRTRAPRWHAWLKWAVTVGLFAYILYRVPLEDLPEVLSEAQPIHLVGGVLASALQIAIYGGRWHALLRPFVRHPLWHTLGLQFLARFYNNFAPGTLGGDVAKSYILARSHDIDGPQTIATVLADRAVGLFSVVAMGLLATFVLDMPQLRITVWAVMGVGLLGILMLAVVLRYGKPIAPEDKKSGLVGLIKKVIDRARQTAVALGNYRSRPAALIIAFVVSCAGMVVAGVALHEYALAFGFYCPISTAVAIIAVLTAVAMIPVSINGLGMTEGTMIVLLTWSGMDETAALGAAVAMRIFAVILSLLGGLLQLLPEPYGPKV